MLITQGASGIYHNVFRGMALTLCVAFVCSVPTAASDGIDMTRVVREATLENGLRVIAIRNPIAPAVSIVTNYLTGSAEDTVPGLAHAQEHMMFRGSGTVSSGGFAEAIGVMGGVFSANTQSEMTQFSLEVPSNDLKSALLLERSRSSGIRDEDPSWNVERSAMRQEIAGDGSSAIFRMIDKAGQAIFAGTPYANFGLGTTDSLNHINGDGLRAFYQKWYHPNNMLLVIDGDIDPMRTIDLVREIFGDLQPAALPPRATSEPIAVPVLHLLDHSGEAYSVVFAAFRTPGSTDKDYFSSRILKEVLSSDRGDLSSLQSKGTVFQAFAQTAVHRELAMTVVGAAFPVSSRPDAILTSVLAVLNNYREKGIPADLVDAAKRRELMAVAMTRTSILDEALSYSGRVGIENRTPDEDIALLNAVTADSVTAVLRRYFSEPHVTGVATPAAGAGAAFAQPPAEELPHVRPSPQELPPFMRDVLSSSHLAPATRGVIDRSLRNGMRVVVVPMPGSDVVSIRATNHSLIGDKRWPTRHLLARYSTVCCIIVMS